MGTCSPSMSHWLGCSCHLIGFQCLLLLAPDDLICILLFHCFYYTHLFLRITLLSLSLDLWKQVLLLLLGPPFYQLPFLYELFPCYSSVYTLCSHQTSSITLQAYTGGVHYSQVCPISLNLHMDSLLSQSYRVVEVRHHLHFLHKVSHHCLPVHVWTSCSLGWSRWQKACYY